jgi:hypothetical protein
MIELMRLRKEALLEAENFSVRRLLRLKRLRRIGVQGNGRVAGELEEDEGGMIAAKHVCDGKEGKTGD